MWIIMLGAMLDVMLEAMLDQLQAGGKGSIFPPALTNPRC